MESGRKSLPYQELKALALQCQESVKGLDADCDALISMDLFAGEPECAIAEALDVAASLNRQDLIPASVVELTHNPEYPIIQRFEEFFPKAENKESLS